MKWSSNNLGEVRCAMAETSLVHTVLRARAPALLRFADDDMDEAAIMEYTSSVSAQRCTVSRC